MTYYNGKKFVFEILKILFIKTIHLFYKKKIMEIESYLLKDLAKLEDKHPTTVKNSKRYIAIRIYSPTIQKRYELGKQSKPYSIRYIRLADIQKALKWNIDFNYITK